MEAHLSEDLQKFLELEQQFLEWRKAHPEETPEEDELLDEMEYIWWKLSHEERQWVKDRNAAERMNPPQNE
jgi:hypothetical protein